MTNNQISLIQASWKQLAATAPDAGQHFYQKLFELAPSVRHLFKTDIHDQAKKLVTMLSFVVAKLKNLDEIQDQIKGLAQRHAGYGAQPAHYEAVGQALIWMLEHELGEQWNQPTKMAWIEAYTILSSAMIEASEVPVTQ